MNENGEILRSRYPVCPDKSYNLKWKRLVAPEENSVINMYLENGSACVDFVQIEELPFERTWGGAIAREDYTIIPQYDVSYPDRRLTFDFFLQLLPKLKERYPSAVYGAANDKLCCFNVPVQDAIYKKDPDWDWYVRFDIDQKLKVTHRCWEHNGERIRNFKVGTMNRLKFFLIRMVNFRVVRDMEHEDWLNL